MNECLNLSCCALMVENIFISDKKRRTFCLDISLENLYKGDQVQSRSAATETAVVLRLHCEGFIDLFFFPPTAFYSPYRTLAFLNGLLDPQTFGRTPWLGDQSNTRPSNIVRVIKLR
jgi:hypothetical protein